MKWTQELELSRAHTPCTLNICRFLHRDRPVMLMISTSPVVVMVDGRGYDSGQNDAICDVRGPCLTIWRTFKPVCRWFRLIGYAYELLRYLDVEIWRFSWCQQTDRLLYPYACAGVMTGMLLSIRGNISTTPIRLILWCIQVQPTLEIHLQVATVTLHIFMAVWLRKEAEQM